MPALPQTIISGVAYDEQGNVAPGVRLKVIKAIKSGQVIKLQPRTIATSNASGVFERSTGVADFLLPRNSTVWLSGSFFNGATSFKSDNGISVAIPDSGTATLEGLGAGAVVPVQGVTVQSNGTPTANLISIFNFTTGLSAVESPTGTVTVSSTAVAPAWGVITGTLASQTDLNSALALKAPLASPTFTGTVAGITSTMVGLGNVNNTSDANKPVSTAQQTALDLKANLISPSFTTPTLGVASATSLTASGDIAAGAANNILWTGRAKLSSPSDGNLAIVNAAGTVYGTFQGNNFRGISSGLFSWSPGGDASVSPDATIARDAAGVIKAGTSTANALGALLGGRVVLAKTGNYTIVAASDNGKCLTNQSAAGTVVFTLPTAVVGLTFSFYVDVTQTLQVTAGASTTIRIAGAVSAAAGNITNNVIGGSVTLLAISATQWVAIGAPTGTWTVT